MTFSWGVWQWYNDTQWSSGVEWQCFTLISNAVIIWCGSSWHVLLVFRTSHSSFCWRPSVCALVLFRTFASSLRFYLIGNDLHLYYLGILGQRVKVKSMPCLCWMRLCLLLRRLQCGTVNDFVPTIRSFFAETTSWMVLWLLWVARICGLEDPDFRVTAPLVIPRSQGRIV